MRVQENRNDFSGEISSNSANGGRERGGGGESVRARVGERERGIGVCFFFQADDGKRGVEGSRGLGDVCQRQIYKGL